MSTPPLHYGQASGFILWFTGLPSSGKTSLAEALVDTLQSTMRVQLLDGDVLRHTISRDLDYSRADRLIQAERTGYVARMLAAHGVAVVVATISPYQEAREQERARAEADGLPFLDVFVEAALPTLESRDRKGLYRRVREGENLHLTGVTDPYEPPAHPDVHVRTDQEPLEVSRDRVLAAVRARGLCPPPRQA